MPNIISAMPINAGVPELEVNLHWNNSSNVLCNYMKRQEYLDLILQNQAISPRYVIEPLDYLELGEIKKICYPMTCFCDIPFSKVSTHMSHYGEYGIALDKVALLKKYRVQPIHYINDHSPLAEDFRKVFMTFYNSSLDIEGKYELLLNYMVSTLVYMKPICGQEKNKEGNLEEYVYQDECEWRYIPSDRFPTELGSIILPQHATSEKMRNIYSEVLAKHKECSLTFEWEDVRYIMVPDEMAVKHTISAIMELMLQDEEKYFLISKIEISRRFSDNM